MRLSLFPLTRLVLGLVLVFSLSGFSALEALFAPKADLWDRWLTHDNAAARKIDHEVWDQFLKTYVKTDEKGLNRVRYRDVTAADREQLDAYIQLLSRTPISAFSRAEQLAFWINAYNALTVQVILNHYPVKSIQDIDLGSGLFSSGPWGARLFQVEGAELSLNDIEHRILRPIWKDPRIHYAVNCASIGCPNLQASAYTGDWVESMLEDGATAFINGPRNIQVQGDKVTVSKIYSWFEDDFGGSGATVLNHLRTYAFQDIYDDLAGVTKISGYTYDWALNE